MKLHRRSVLKAMAAAPALTVAPALAAVPVAAADKWKPLADDVRDQMAWAWRHYAERCMGQDQIKPVSGGAEAFFFPKGPPLGLTIVEALDTLCDGPGRRAGRGRALGRGQPPFRHRRRSAGVRDRHPHGRRTAVG